MRSFDWSLAVYLGLLVYYVVGVFRSPELEPGDDDYIPDDEGNYLRFAMFGFLAWWVALILPFVTEPWQIGLPIFWVILGVIVFFFGNWLRNWSIRVLDRHFTYKLALKRDHQLVESGPYRYIRHPSYSGAILEMLGLILVSRSVLSLAVYLVSAGLVYGVRIWREEKLLEEYFGERYREYKKRTKRLIPFIF